MTLHQRLTLLLLVLVTPELSFAKKSVLDRVQEQLETVALSKANALNAVRQMKALRPSEAQLGQLAIRYNNVKDLHRISASQIASVILGTFKEDPVKTEAARQAARAQSELIQFVRDYEKSVTISKMNGSFSAAEVNERKSRLVRALQIAWTNREAIWKLYQNVRKWQKDLGRLDESQRQKLVKDAEEVGNWPDFSQV